MFSTELSHRVFLTVLLLQPLLGVIGKQHQQQRPASLPNLLHNDKRREGDEEQGRILAPIISSRSTRTHDHDPEYRSIFDESRHASSSSSAQSHPSSVMIKANLPFSTSAAVNDFSAYNRRNGLAPYPNNGNFFDCFLGRNCPAEDVGDEWRNYYSVLNGLAKPAALNERRLHQLSFGTDSSAGITASIPFIVDANANLRRKDESRHSGAGSDNKSNLNSNSIPFRSRLTRTTTSTTSSPNWVKLQPLPSHMYDPFSQKINKSESGGNSQFASRLGNAGKEEMSPETFADRYGWNRDSLRIPSWLEELNYQHGVIVPGSGSDEGHHHKRPSYGGHGHRDGPGHGSGPSDDDGKGWVKLDPIPVSGVTISKWVPKGTSPGELPSTNWPVRDKPNAWWDRIDVGPSRPEPSWSDGPIRSPLLASNSNSGGWGSSRYPPSPNFGNNKKQHSHGQSMNNAWSDVIYPDTPSSATASWESSKSGASGSSSFPSSWLSKVSTGNKQQSASNNRPVASWSAPGSSSSGSSKTSAGRFGSHSHSSGQGHRPSYSQPPSSPFGRPSFYPDPSAGPNDPRWVLVSTTGEMSSKNPYKGHSDAYDNGNFPYEFQPNNRHSKDMNLTKLALETTLGQLTQDELFRRTNETLQSLAPVLHHRDGVPATSTEETESFHTYTPLLDDDAMDVVFESSRASRLAASKIEIPGTTTTTTKSPVPKDNRRSILQGINPVLAAVGVGMIPATIAAVLPAALGRRKKRHVDWRREKSGEGQNTPRLVVDNHYFHYPTLLSSSAPNLYKFLRKPALKRNVR